MEYFLYLSTSLTVPRVMVGGCAASSTVTVSVDAALVPQELLAVTAILPFCPAAPEVTEIEVDPCPPLMVHPVGTVQL